MNGSRSIILLANTILMIHFYMTVLRGTSRRTNKRVGWLQTLSFVGTQSTYRRRGILSATFWGIFLLWRHFLVLYIAWCICMMGRICFTTLVFSESRQFTTWQQTVTNSICFIFKLQQYLFPVIVSTRKFVSDIDGYVVEVCQTLFEIVNFVIWIFFCIYGI